MIWPPPLRYPSSYISELSFIGKDPGFVQTRDQELSIAPIKIIKLQLPRELELGYIGIRARFHLILGDNYLGLFAVNRPFPLKGDVPAVTRTGK